MKVVLIVLLAIVAYSQAQEERVIYPYCRCCDWYHEQRAFENLVNFVYSYPYCSPIISCLRRCLYNYNYKYELTDFKECSINTNLMLDFYKWLLYNYQCLPCSVLDCVKRCITNFERYPSCYWTINAELGVDVLSAAKKA